MPLLLLHFFFSGLLIMFLVFTGQEGAFRETA